MRVTVTFYEDGSIKHVDGPGLSFLQKFGETSRRRASHVEPANRLLRWLFQKLRAACRDDSPLAAFTRKWPCRWQANLALSRGPVLGPYWGRDDAIGAEVEWIETNILGGSVMEVAGTSASKCCGAIDKATGKESLTIITRRSVTTLD